MGRRGTRFKVNKAGQYRPDHVKGQSDILYKVFNCLNSDCQYVIATESSNLEGEYSFACPKCDFVHEKGGYLHLFSYEIEDNECDATVDHGNFGIEHDDHIEEAADFKYCLYCNALKPVSEFDRHNSRPRTGRQEYCTTCKGKYNDLKNSTRTADQHREASDRSRTHQLLSNEAYNIDSQAVFRRFDERCFNCGAELEIDADGRGHFNLDHTLPAALLWDRTTENATLLCDDNINGCNGAKDRLWPSDFYNEDQLRELAVRTSIPYSVLAGSPRLNPDAVSRALKRADEIIEKLIDDPEELCRLRNLILKYKKKDLFSAAKNVPSYIDCGQ